MMVCVNIGGEGVRRKRKEEKVLTGRVWRPTLRQRE